MSGNQGEWDSQGPLCVCVCVCVAGPFVSGEECAIKHIRSFHQDCTTFPSPIVSAWLDYELPVLSDCLSDNQGATSWVLHQAGGSIKTRVEEQSSSRGAAWGTFFHQWAFDLGQLLSPCCTTWKLSSCEWPGGGACLSDRQADGPTFAPGVWESPGSAGIQALQKNIWIPLIYPDRQSAEQDKDGPCRLDQRNSSTKHTCGPVR